MKLKNKSVLITGASSGIGKSLAYEFAKKGCDLILTARRLERLEEIAEEIKKKWDRKVVVAACDVTRDGDLEKAVAAGKKDLGKIDIVIANAGYHVSGKVEALTLDDFRRQFETNIFGVLRTVYASLEELKNSRGSLVIIGSVAGYVALPRSAAYSMSKSAIHALSHSLSHELNPYGIHVTLIAPGFVVSDIREVDNFNVHHPSEKEPRTSLFRMETSKAAQQIVQAIARQRKEKVITRHGQAAVFIQRHFPSLVSMAVGWTQRKRE